MAENSPVKWTLIVVEHATEPMLIQFADLMRDSPVVDVVTCPGVEAVSYHLHDQGRFVLVIPTPSNEDVRGMQDFMLKLKEPIKEGWVIPVALNRILTDDAMRGRLKNLGFADVISSASIKPSGLKRRINSLISIMSRRLKGERRAIESPEWKSLLRSAEKPRYLPPLDLLEDCWLFRGGDDVKRIKDMWIVNLMGPAPPAGFWERKHASEEGDLDLWEWRPKPAGGFVTPNGSWIFRGQRPVFSDYHWIFVSKNPRLSYFKEDAKDGVDFFSVARDGKFEIHNNSDHAKRRWNTIRNSILQEYRISPDKVLVDDPPFFAVITPANQVNLSSRLKEHETPVPWRAILGLPPQAETGNALFSRVDTQEKRKGYVHELHKKHPFATLWTKGQNLKINTRVMGFDLKSETVFLDLLGKPFVGEIKNEMMVNIRFQRGSMFFVLSPKEITVEEFKGSRFLKFTLPESIYEVQRRNYVRLDIPDEKLLFATIDGEIRPIVNLSAGGCAFLGDSFELNDFPKGKKLENIKFNIDMVEIRCSAEVRWARKRTNASAGADLVVGVQFVGIKARDEQRISLYVLEEGFDLKGKE